MPKLTYTLANYAWLLTFDDTGSQVEAARKAGVHVDSIRKARRLLESGALKGVTPQPIAPPPNYAAQLQATAAPLQATAAPPAIDPAAFLEFAKLLGFNLAPAQQPPQPESTPATPQPDIEPPQNKAVTFTKKTAIFTAWEIRTSTNPKFIDILLQLSREYDGQLFLVPVWPADLDYLPPAYNAFTVLTQDLRLNNNIQFKYSPTHALVKSPVTGWASSENDTSLIVPGLVRDMITLPTNTSARQVMSTGAVGYLNADLADYSHVSDDDHQRKLAQRWASVTNRRNGRVYAQAMEHTLPSALIVDILDERTFLSRYVAMPTDGVVYDLNRKFTAGKSGSEVSKPAGLVVGDTHAWNVEPTSHASTLDMIRVLDPETVVLNDFFDGCSINHHEIADHLKHAQMPTLEEEAEATRALLKEYTDTARHVSYLHSNHDNFINKWLQNESNWKHNRNYVIALELQLYRAKEGKHPIRWLLGLDEIENLTFYSEHDALVIAGNTGKHGHEGRNGMRAAFRALVEVYKHYFQGHTHSPGVFRNGANAGTDAKLKQSYAIGASGWMAANIIEQPDGAQQVITKPRGLWRRQYAAHN